MDRWTKIGVISGGIATIVIVLEFFGVQPTGAVVKGVHFESVIVGLLILATWVSVYLGYRHSSKTRLVAAPPAVNQLSGTAESLIPYSDWEQKYIEQVCTRKQHTGFIDLHFAQHRGCTFTNCTFQWDGYVAVLEDCHFS